MIREDEGAGTTVGKLLFAPMAETSRARMSLEGIPPSPRLGGKLYSAKICACTCNHSSTLHCDAFLPLLRMRRPLAEARKDSSSPSVLKKLNNYTWVPKGCSVDMVGNNFTRM